MSGYSLVFSSCPDAETANRIANDLVERRLAACVNIIPGATSVYRWEGRVVTATEQVLLIKTHQQMLHSLQEALLESHPYDTPELVSVHIDNGLPAYLAWLEDSLDPAEG